MGRNNMKAAVISDIHIDINHNEKEPVIDSLRKVLVQDMPEILIIAGDISNDYQKTLEFLKQTDRTVPTIFVPGNHDLWNIENQQQDTWKIYNALGNYQHNLCTQNYIINDEWVVCGECGWYDYSFADREFPIELIQEGSYMQRKWKDKDYIKWGKKDAEIFEIFYSKLEKKMNEVKDKKIIMVTHMLTHKEFTVRDHPMWKFFNAFLGSSRYGELIKKYDVKYSIMGHVHYRKELEEKGTRYICACLNYTNEWEGSISPYDQIKQTIKYINI